MPTGLKVPVRVSQSGGAAIETSEPEQLKKMLFLALSEGDDDNPFQLLGLPGNLIFQVQGSAFRGKAERALNNVLAKFADRISLRPDEPIKFEEKGDGEIEMSFEYIDLLTDKVEDFRARFLR